uniref:Uncharacterized protein n=1 Tax=Bubo bubo TaxID=30461 RepID=A0A8C0ERZ8_BUBBB
MKELFMAAAGTSGAFRNDLLTPDSSATISCRGFTTGIPGTKRVGETVSPRSSKCGLPAEGDHKPLTCRHQLGLVFLIPHLLLLHIAAREEETHHPVEELMGQLDGEGYHVHLRGERPHQSQTHAASLEAHPLFLLAVLLDTGIGH